MITYECKACERHLFISDAPVGRLRLVCPYRDCRHPQEIYLGGYRPGWQLDRVLAAVRGALSERADPPDLRNGHTLR